MTGSESNLFSAEFLDDYFAECEGHLVVVRRDLLLIEEFLAQSKIDPPLLEELFRSFHTLKGISGMVGLYEAEQLAHEMEGYLRALREAQVALTPEGIDGLIAGTKMLELVLAARRANQPIPDITPVIEQLTVLVSDNCLPEARVSSYDPAAKLLSGLNAEESGRLVAELQSGASAWRCRFTPAPALAERGVNVNTIRARLQEVGELIHAAPLVTAQEGIVFEFIVALRAGEKALAGWSEDGLTYTPYEIESSLVLAPVVGNQRDHAPAVGPLNGWQDRSKHIPAGSTVAPSNVVRVDLGRLDNLMQMVGNLVISRARLKDHLDRLESILPSSEWRTLQETNFAIERQLRELREGVIRMRMVPVGEVFERMKFVVRDLARATEKKINLELTGQETEIDKFLVEQLMDPLLHLVRNAVSHGLESVDDRVNKGKPPEGKLALRAATAGEMVVIEIEDDGRGIEMDQVAARARKLGLIGPSESLKEAGLLDVICAPGFSMREEADRASGRGVGMAVVKNTISELGGSLALETNLELGTRFTIQLPLTLAITSAIIVTAGGQRFAVPQSSVREVIEISPEAVKVIENNEILQYREGALPLVRLARLFGLVESNQRTFHAFIVGKGLHAVGVVVDRILGMREIVVRATTDPLLRVPGIAGATELGDGRLILILDAIGLIRERASNTRC